jgi:hypothetical protein
MPPKARKLRYHAVPDPRRPGHFRVKDSRSTHLVGVSFPNERLAARAATRRNNRRDDEGGR